MFAYCNSSPISYSDNSGQRMVYAHDCGCGTNYYPYPDRSADDHQSVYDKLIKPIAQNINITISGGLGFGMYAEGDLSGLEVGLGTYYDLVAFEWQDGEVSTYEYGYAGVSSTVLLFDFGAEASVLVRENQKPISERWLLFNDQKDSFSILGVAFYTPIFGGRFEVSLR